MNNIEITATAYNTLCKDKDFIKEDFVLSEFEIESLGQFLSRVRGNYLLDLGCGRGRLSEYCHNSTGLSVIGCDISTGMLDIANKNNKYPDKIKFILHDMISWTSTIKFDAAIASFSFIHLTREQARMALVNLHELLNKNAEIYISLLEGTSAGYVNDPYDKSIITFVKFYTLEEINELLINAGFEIQIINRGIDVDPGAFSKDAIFIIASKP